MTQENRFMGCLGVILLGFLALAIPSALFAILPAEGFMLACILFITFVVMMQNGD